MQLTGGRVGHRKMIEAMAVPAGPIWLCSGLGAVLGAMVGSFLGAVVVRLPAGRSIVNGRSACDSCGRVLAPIDLVPVLSYLALRGRCRTCRAPIDPWQFACEAGGAIIGAVPWLVAGSILHAAAAMLMGWVLLLLAVLDLRHFWLPHRVIAVLAGMAGLFAGVRSWEAGWNGAVLVPAIAGGMIGFAILWTVRIVYRRSRGRDGMGAADPLLLGAIGLWIGPLGVIEVLLGASILGIAAALALLLTARKVAADTPLPLGTLLAAAAWPLFLAQGFG